VIRGTGFQSRRTPASAVDAMRLGLRRLAHWAGDARALYEMPEAAGSLTPDEPLGRSTQKLESQARPPAGAAHALRLALRRQTHSEPDANTFHQLLQAALGLKAARVYQERCASRYRVRPEGSTPERGISVQHPSLFLKSEKPHPPQGASQMRTHFTICAKRSAASDHGDQRA